MNKTVEQESYYIYNQAIPKGLKYEDFEMCEEVCRDLQQAMQDSCMTVPLSGGDGEHYVYVVSNNIKRYCDIIYIGSGKNGRYKHVNSGGSHSRELNRMHFDGVKVETYIFSSGLSKEDATKLEKEMISLFNPTANTMGITPMGKSKHRCPWDEAEDIKDKARKARQKDEYKQAKLEGQSTGWEDPALKPNTASNFNFMEELSKVCAVATRL